MTPPERHAELGRLRAVWAEAVFLAGVPRPGTLEWHTARLDERHAAAKYLRVLADPYQPGSQTDVGEGPTQAEPPEAVRHRRTDFASATGGRPPMSAAASRRQPRRHGGSRGRTAAH